MKALAFHGPRDVRWEEVPDARLEADGDALLRVRLAGLCGSDLHVYHGRERGLDPGTVMGHECAGEVLAVGPGVQTHRPGDTVVAPFTTSCGACFFCRSGLTCRCERGQLFGWVEDGRGLHGAQAALLRVPLADATLVPVPDGLPLAHALLAADVLPTGLFGAELAGVSEDERVAVIGCGPVGLCALLGAFLRGAATVVAIDPVPFRRELAASFRATPASPQEARDLVRSLTDGRGVDAVIEVVGTGAATRLALDLVRAGGAIGAIGVHTEPTFPFGPGALYDLNLTYRAGRCPARRGMEALLADLGRWREPLDALVTHRLPLSEGPEAYRLFDARGEGCVKVLLEPDQP